MTNRTGESLGKRVKGEETTESVKSLGKRRIEEPGNGIGRNSMSR